MHLLLIGPGFSAMVAAERLRPRLSSLTATARSAEAAARLSASGITPVAFDGGAPSPDLAAAIGTATHVIVSVPPDEAGDPVLRHHGADIAARRGTLPAVVYLSTIGVYGDHGGAWVDETTPPRPAPGRSSRRLIAEAAWRRVGQEAGAPVALLRLAGIYGPGRNPFIGLADGTARRVVKPGQIFNRIHVADIAAAVEAAFDLRFDGPVNVADDEPGPPEDVIAYAAGLMEMAPPPAIPFEAADLSAMARSFYAESKRASNRLLRTRLGVDLAFPTYRHGLDHLWRSGTWRGEAA